ncbi:hypothetical protein Mal4_41650 [Maioricimonas rarisocia]|uniref:Lipoprotein n=1 Tax=Maioricimonas rarisocia TaxID=2528026 RepID=A0A517ZBI0_9PLAN|nr:hypothetical protein Mal4_41650 [Maioricimonas rarisocia]
MARWKPTLVQFAAGMLFVVMLSGCQLDSGLRMPGDAPPQSEPPLTDTGEG